MDEKEYQVGIYCRLSKDDSHSDESVSIGTQRSILEEYCRDKGYHIQKIYIDDGFSGSNFQRPAFQNMLEDIGCGSINMILTKDLSRLGRDYIMTGYYTDIFFPEKGIRYIALSDGFDSDRDDNDIAPFKNILNDMYAREISKKIKHAKRQRAKGGNFVGSYAPYGYKKCSDNHNKLEPDEQAAEVVRLIFQLALQGMGTVEIAAKLETWNIMPPRVYKEMQGIHSFQRYSKSSVDYHWCPASVQQILKNRTYLGELIYQKYEVLNYKTGKRGKVPEERQIIIQNAHSALIRRSDFDEVQRIIRSHRCPSKESRSNIFRGLLYCKECGHSLSIAHRKLSSREEDSYRCMNHYYHPEVCRQTHCIYHNMLSEYVLEQIKSFAKSMKRRKVKTPIASLAEIDELTHDILNLVIRRIEIGHISKKTKSAQVIKIDWKLV